MFEPTTFCIRGKRLTVKITRAVTEANIKTRVLFVLNFYHHIELKSFVVFTLESLINNDNEMELI